MKTLKFIFSIMLIAIIILTSCSKNGDPTPATPKQMTALDSVKASMTGTWKFTSMTVTEVSTKKSATTATCSKTELKATGLFTNTNWQYLTLEMDYTYSSSIALIESNACVTATASAKVAAVKNTDDSVTITVDPGSGTTVYNVKSKDITATSIKATLISDGKAVSATYGYNVVITFTRS